MEKKHLKCNYLLYLKVTFFVVKNFNLPGRECKMKKKILIRMYLYYSLLEMIFLRLASRMSDALTHEEMPARALLCAR